MKDKYGSELVIGSRVAKWGIPFESNDWIYGTVVSFDVSNVMLPCGDEDIIVAFDDMEYEYNDNKGDVVVSQNLILCETDEEKEHTVIITLEVSAKSAHEAYDKVKRWQDKNMQRSRPEGTTSIMISLPPKP